MEVPKVDSGFNQWLIDELIGTIEVITDRITDLSDKVEDKLREMENK